MHAGVNTCKALDLRMALHSETQQVYLLLQLCHICCMHCIICHAVT